MSHLSATLVVVSTGSSPGKAASVYFVKTGTRERNAFGYVETRSQSWRRETDTTPRAEHDREKRSVTIKRKGT